MCAGLKIHTKYTERRGRWIDGRKKKEKTGGKVRWIFRAERTFFFSKVERRQFIDMSQQRIGLIFLFDAHFDVLNKVGKGIRRDWSLERDRVAKLLVIVQSVANVLLGILHRNLSPIAKYTPRRLTFTWWGCCRLFLQHKPIDRAWPTSFNLFLCLFLPLWPFQLYFIP